MWVEGHNIKMFIGTFFFVGICFTEPSQLLQFIRRDNLDGKFYCTICDSFSHPRQYNTRDHVEAKHFPNSFQYNCDQCSDVFSNAKSLSNHRHRKHRQSLN